jgi:hypothetical protein
MGFLCQIKPTIRPSGSFNPERIAAKMQKAMKGMGEN